MIFVVEPCGPDHSCGDELGMVKVKFSRLVVHVLSCAKLLRELHPRRGCCVVLIRGRREIGLRHQEWCEVLVPRRPNTILA